MPVSSAVPYALAISPGNEIAYHLVAILANSPLCVPHLSSLQFLCFNPPMQWYQNLAKALLARRNQITYVSVEAHVVPPPDIIFALQQLAADGLTIHVGMEDYNFL
jgi:hypothetical protein